MRTEDYTYSKTSLYLRDDLKARIHKLTTHIKQTEFINRSIQEKLEKEEKEMNKKEFLKLLHSIKPVKRKYTARQTLEKLRKERTKQLLKNLKS